MPLAVTVGVSPASADPITDTDLVRFQPLAEFGVATEGAWINWTVVELPSIVEDGHVPDGYELHRISATAGTLPTIGPDGLPVLGTGPSQSHIVVETIPYHTGAQDYAYLDTSYDASMASLYYVQAVDVEVDGEGHGLPSNPVGNYPRCGWARADTDPLELGFRFGCIIPVPGSPYPSCAPLELYIIPLYYQPHTDCLLPGT